MKNQSSACILAGLGGAAPELLPLNLIFDYPVKWGAFKVLRDFLQNFYDAVGQENWSQQFSHRVDEDVLLLQARDVGFSYDWLVPIGASTKREGRGQYAGFFGEGFKIASLCALRDHGWNVEMASRDWELRVIVHHVTIDGRTLPSLAYHLWKSRSTRRDTVLALHPFRPQDHAELRAALESFYYPHNPLFGAKLWSTETAAVWRRSDVAKPVGFPATYSLRGEGILYAGYQAMGSFPFPLVIALHDYRHHDRERDTFYEMDVMDAIKRVCALVPPECAFELMEVFRGKWSCYPKKKHDFGSWHPIVARLTERLSRSETATRRWREKREVPTVARGGTRQTFQPGAMEPAPSSPLVAASRSAGLSARSRRFSRFGVRTLGVGVRSGGGIRRRPLAGNDGSHGHSSPGRADRENIARLLRPRACTALSSDRPRVGDVERHGRVLSPRRTAHDHPRLSRVLSTPVHRSQKNRLSAGGIFERLEHLLARIGALLRRRSIGKVLTSADPCLGNRNCQRPGHPPRRTGMEPVVFGRLSLYHLSPTRDILR